MSIVDEAAVVERDQRDDGREGAAGVQALIDGVAALFEGENADVRVLDGQQFQNALAQHVVIGGSRRAHAARVERGGSQQEMSSANCAPVRGISWWLVVGGGDQPLPPTHEPRTTNH